MRTNQVFLYFYVVSAHGMRMGRPTTKKNGRPVNLWLSQESVTEGGKIAFQCYDEKSLSWLVDRLLIKEIKRRKEARDRRVK